MSKLYVTMDMNPVEGCRCHSCQTRRHSQDYGRAAIFYAIEAGYKAQEAHITSWMN